MFLHADSVTYTKQSLPVCKTHHAFANHCEISNVNKNLLDSQPQEHWLGSSSQKLGLPKQNKTPIHHSVLFT